MLCYSPISPSLANFFPVSVYLVLKVILLGSVTCNSVLYDFVMLDLLVDSQLPG
ncbi:hypothetical protein XF_1227 [Xylella fastidiosa 9a5c]|uniref:Uncharacterized protein n=1 Tax=Xylella fastidiosa (strain 9a5c) TaxID=160492 RepID=Q9PE01_XYLFA|nr:hypothetical protein XF_1227 [Xylella fastidiosa 9a5c]